MMLSVSLTAARRGWVWWAAVFPRAFPGPAAHAQSQQQDADPNPPDGTSSAISAVPIFSAGMAYNTFIPGGTPNLHPLLSPVILIPLGQNWLVESRDTLNQPRARPGERATRATFKKKSIISSWITSPTGM